MKVGEAAAKTQMVKTRNQARNSTSKTVNWTSISDRNWVLGKRMAWVLHNWGFSQVRETCDSEKPCLPEANATNGRRIPLVTSKYFSSPKPSCVRLSRAESL